MSELTPALVQSKSRVQHADTKCLLWCCLPWALGKTILLLKAVDAVELEHNRDRVIHVVQARLARKTLAKLRDQGLVKYTAIIPS